MCKCTNALPTEARRGWELRWEFGFAAAKYLRSCDDHRSFQKSIILKNKIAEIIFPEFLSFRPMDLYFMARRLNKAS